MILQAPAYGNWDSLSSLSSLGSLGSLSWDSLSILGADDAGGPSRIKTHMAADENPCSPQWWTSEIAGQCGFIQAEKPWCKRFWAIPAPKSPPKTETNQPTKSHWISPRMTQCLEDHFTDRNWCFQVILSPRSVVKIPWKFPSPTGWNHRIQPLLLASYPLVNFNYGKIHHFSWLNPRFQWPFSIVFCRSLPEGNHLRSVASWTLPGIFLNSCTDNFGMVQLILRIGRRRRVTSFCEKNTDYHQNFTTKKHDGQNNKITHVWRTLNKRISNTHRRFGLLIFVYSLEVPTNTSGKLHHFREDPDYSSHHGLSVGRATL